jgi:hypothetical protein
MLPIILYFWFWIVGIILFAAALLITSLFPPVKISPPHSDASSSDAGSPNADSDKFNRGAGRGESLPNSNARPAFMPGPGWTFARSTARSSNVIWFVEDRSLKVFGPFRPLGPLRPFAARNLFS